MIQIEDPSIALREEEEEDDPDVDVDLDDGESEKDEEIEDIDFPSRPQEADENPFLEPPLSSNSPSEGEQTMPTWETKPDKGVQGTLQRARKRSHDELPDDSIFVLLGVQKKDGATTPPKRQRVDAAWPAPTTPSKDASVALAPTPMRARKRSSEELDDEQVNESAHNGKRAKAAVAEVPATS